MLQIEVRNVGYILLLMIQIEVRNVSYNCSTGHYIKVLARKKLPG
ncbi:hypothetical protein [Okeania sp. SIO3B5]|nr:hypothetical protein [Okeania sp. SIO3B5]